MLQKNDRIHVCTTFNFSKSFPGFMTPPTYQPQAAAWEEGKRRRGQAAHPRLRGQLQQQEHGTEKVREDAQETDF